MKSKNNLFLTTILAMTLVFGMAVIGCDNGSDDGIGGSGGSGGSGSGGGTGGTGGGGGISGGLRGTSWEQKDNYTSSSIPASDITITITFTTDDTLTIKRAGWYDWREMKINGYNISYVTTRITVNETYTGTYEYWSNIKEGYINSDYWNINPWNFRILSDNKTMAAKLSTTQFTKK